jgi:DNA replication and repair protein RecF
MLLKTLQLFNFKNHADLRLDFKPGINAITGSNGSGKTNVLDAIFFLSNGKSFFNSIDSQLVRNDADFFSLHGWFEDDIDILVQFDPNRKKTIKRNQKAYKRLIDHIGYMQTVFITPYDIALVNEGSEERRRFVDYTLCQTSATYLQALSQYKKSLEARNALLKAAEGRPLDPILLEAYDEKLAGPGQYLAQARAEFSSEFIVLLNEVWNHLSGPGDVLTWTYESQWSSATPYREFLAQAHAQDCRAGRSTRGIHKDDWAFELNGYSLKRMGSQGQIKSAIIAMKLAQFDYFKSKTGKTPILLLDDIFEKIDKQRADALIQWVGSGRMPQIFITDTHYERIRSHTEQLGLALSQHHL